MGVAFFVSLISRIMSKMNYANGRIPDSYLSSIPGGRLRHDAAAAWNAMVVEARHRGFAVPYPAGSVSSYRPYSAQVYFWNLYQSGRGNPAARPGTSNHGWGVAVDVKSDGWRTMQILGSKYGFTHIEGAQVHEAWHWSNAAGPNAKFPRFTQEPEFRPLRYRSSGPRVRWVQRRLRAHGFKSVAGPGMSGYGFYGAATVSAVKRLQKAHHLTVDGIVGRDTWRVLGR